jgi:ABC-type transport system involved in multi-copper enzyme maturation permease subunit
MIGLLSKIFVELRWIWLGFSLALAIVMGLLTALLPKVLGDIHQLFDSLPFIRPMMTALLGVDPGLNLTSTMSQAFLWVHPTVLTIVWAHEVIYCTRVPAGEVDRGTVDFLLGLPISRMKLFACETIGWLVSGIVILACGYSGHLIASIYLEPEMRPPTMVTAFVMMNFFAVYLAVGGFAFLVSALSDRRGRAMGVVFAVLLISFLVNFIAQFWDPLKRSPTNPLQGQSTRSAIVSPLTAMGVDTTSLPGIQSATGDEQQAGRLSLASFSVMHYYRPAIIIQREQLPWKDILFLLAIGTTCLVAAAICLRHRSICTV